jgi:hypothetical protein
MIRTQIYLSAVERDALAALSVQRGATQSALIREAIDRFLKLATPPAGTRAVEQACGLWADRDDLDEASAYRSEFERFARSEA